ncbi:MAG: biopolymer transporter ExbD [Pseudomonadota bacterium]
MSFGGFNKQNSAPMSEMNTTPLVDVMLVLLIIFIITAPLITNSVNINLPSSKSSATPQKPNIVSVGIDEKERLFWNGKEINEDQLALLLEDAVKNNSNTELQLQADHNTRYEKITDVMTKADQAGISKMGFATRVGN